MPAVFLLSGTEEIIQCLQKQMLMVLWTIAGSIATVALTAGGFVKWIMTTRIELLKDQISQLKEIGEGATGAAKQHAIFWENQYKDCERRLNKSARYSPKQIIVASVTTSVFGVALASFALFLSYGGRLQVAKNEATLASTENEKNNALLRKLTSAFGEAAVQTASQRAPQPVMEFDRTLPSPVLIISGPLINLQSGRIAQKGAEIPSYGKTSE
jgi:hypothetical protein